MEEKDDVTNGVNHATAFLEDFNPSKVSHTLPLEISHAKEMIASEENEMEVTDKFNART